MRLLMKKKVEQTIIGILYAAIVILIASSAFTSTLAAQIAFGVSFFCIAVCLFILAPIELSSIGYGIYQENDDSYLDDWD